MGTENDKMLWKDDMSVSGDSFVRFLQVYSGKNVMMLKPKSLIACPAQAVLLNFSPRRPTWLIYRGHTLIGFLAADNLESPEFLLRMMLVRFMSSLLAPRLRWNFLFR